MFGDTFGKDEDFGKSAPFYFCLNMKKLFTLIFACFISFNAIQAEITWNLSDDGTLTISGTDMPNYIQLNGVAWWRYRDKIKQVVIEDGVTNIGSYSFGGCWDITSVTIPNSVTSIGNNAFSSCKSLTSVTIPNSVTSIGNNAFQNCSGLTSVTIPNSVTSIGNNAFLDCSGLTSVTIPNSVTCIGESVFSGCSALTSVTIPNSVTSIERGAFSGCSALTSISIPESMASIQCTAFEGTKWYDNQSNGMVYAGKILYGYKGTMPSNTSVKIKEGTTGISNGVFSGCSGLISVTIPNSVASIGGSAFEKCTGLTSVTIPNSVTSIGGSAFEKCTGLTSVTIPNSVTKIAGFAFSGCSGLTSVTIGNSVESIGDYAFNNCTSLTSVYITDLVSWCKIKFGSGYANPLCYAEHLYLNEKEIVNLIIPNGVTSIEPGHFLNCKSIISVEIPESVTSIGGSAFYGAKLRNIVVKAKTPPTSGEKVFSVQSYYHTTLLIPEGSWDAYAYSDNWYQFINIREVAYNAVNLTNSKAYMLKSSNEGSYLFYDSVNDCVASLNETALDDTEENVTWMTTEVDGKHYVYNLGAKKFLVADKTNAKTGYRLSDVPASIDIEDGKDAIVFGKSKEFYMVINDKLNVDENLESQIMTSTGINEIDVESNLPIVTYNLNGQRINKANAQKGIYIKNGKKYAK